MDPNSLMGHLGRYPISDDCLISSFGTERRTHRPCQLEAMIAKQAQVELEEAIEAWQETNLPHVPVRNLLKKVSTHL